VGKIHSKSPTDTPQPEVLREAATLPRLGTMVARALRRRCPICGSGAIFTRWFRMKHACPGCGLSFSRGEDGYMLGAIWFNLLAAEAVSVGILVTTVVLTWPNPPWTTLQYSGPAEALVMPLLFYPFSKTLFLVLDLRVRPPQPAPRSVPPPLPDTPPH
jgi:uncharacterized protein (DUF983 family)